MAIIYNKFWKQLIDKIVRKTELKRGCRGERQSYGTLSKYEYVSMESIEKICIALGCGVDAILDFRP